MPFDSDIKILDILFKVMPFVFWKGKHGRYLGGNDNQAHAFGFSSPAGFIGKTIFEIVEDQKLAKIIDDTDNKIMNSGIGVTLEESFVTPNGKKAYLTQKNPIFDNKKNVVGLLGFAMDVTDIKAKQQEAEESNHKLMVEKYELEIAAYQAEKDSQDKFIKFIDKIQSEIQSYKLETLNDKLGISKSDAKVCSTNLTRREKEVLYFLSLNKSPKEIAQALSILDSKEITAKTVQSVIDRQLYPKFEVYSIGQLIEVANTQKLIPFLLDNH